MEGAEIKRKYAANVEVVGLGKKLAYLFGTSCVAVDENLKSEFCFNDRKEFAKFFGVLASSLSSWINSENEKFPARTKQYFEYAVALHYGFGCESEIEDGEYNVAAWENWLTNGFNSWRSGTIGDFIAAVEPRIPTKLVASAHADMVTALEICRRNKQNTHANTHTSTGENHFSNFTVATRNAREALVALAAELQLTNSLPNFTPLLLSLNSSVDDYAIGKYELKFQLQSAKVSYVSDTNLDNPLGWAVKGKTRYQFEGKSITVDHLSAGPGKSVSWRVSGLDTQIEGESFNAQVFGYIDLNLIQSAEIQVSVSSKDVKIKSDTNGNQQAQSANRQNVLKYLKQCLALKIDPDANTEVVLSSTEITRNK